MISTQKKTKATSTIFCVKSASRNVNVRPVACTLPDFIASARTRQPRTERSSLYCAVDGL